MAFVEFQGNYDENQANDDPTVHDFILVELKAIRELLAWQKTAMQDAKQNESQMIDEVIVKVRKEAAQVQKEWYAEHIKRYHPELAQTETIN